MIDENLDAFLNDFGVPIVFGSVRGLGIFNSPDSAIGDGLSISTDYTVLVRSSVFGSLKFNDAITVNGVAFVVRENLLMDDGKFCRVFLKKP